MTEYILLSEAQKACKGSVIILCQSLGETKRGIGKDGTDWMKQTATVADESATIQMTLWNEDIGRLQPGLFYKLEQPYWKMYEGTPQLSLGKYYKLHEATGDDMIPLQTVLPEGGENESDGTLGHLQKEAQKALNQAERQVKQEPTPEDIIKFVSEELEITDETIDMELQKARRKACLVLLEKAGIEDIMNKVGIQHPSRVSFMTEVMRRLG